MDADDPAWINRSLQDQRSWGKEMGRQGRALTQANGFSASSKMNDI